MTRWVAALCAGGILHAQAMRNDTFHLDNGAQVFYQTYSQADLTDRARMFGATSASGNTIRRTMTDGTNRTWLGFALQIMRLPGDPIRFRISMAPLDLWGFFGWSAPRVKFIMATACFWTCCKSPAPDERFTIRSRWGSASTCR